MSAKNEEVIEGGALRPSGDVDDGQDAIFQIVQHIAVSALGEGSKLRPDAQFQIDLRSGERCCQVLEKLIRKVAPAEVNPLP